jgi:hypothetical protein
VCVCLCVCVCVCVFAILTRLASVVCHIIPVNITIPSKSVEAGAVERAILHIMRCPVDVKPMSCLWYVDLTHVYAFADVVISYRLQRSFFFEVIHFLTFLLK